MRRESAGRPRAAVTRAMVKSANEVKTAIERCALFRALPPAALARMAENVSILKPRRDTLIYGAGESIPGFYSVVSGRIMLSVGAPPDAIKVIDLIGTGGYFGLAATMLDAPQATTAATVVDSTLLLVPHSALLVQAAEHAKFGLQVSTALSREVFALTDDIEAYSLQSGRQRVANYLLRMAGASAARARPFALPAKKSIIASRLGLTPEYFSRMLHELIVERVIEVAGRNITILNATGLRGLTG
jgi:CRP-like cAMP-binding protein